MFVYIENSKKYTKMLLKLIIVFSKVIGYKNTRQTYKSQLYFYTLAVSICTNI